jgi:hypothetical protein
MGAVDFFEFCVASFGEAQTLLGPAAMTYIGSSRWREF